MEGAEGASLLPLEAGVFFLFPSGEMGSEGSRALSKFTQHGFGGQGTD